MDSTAALQTNNIPYLEATPKSRRCFQGISYALGIIALLGIGCIIASRFTFMGTTGTIVGGVTLGLSIPLLILSIKRACRKNEESTANPQVDTTSSLPIQATRTKQKLTEESLVFDIGDYLAKSICEAIKKLNPSPFMKILICESRENKSDLYFQFGDGNFYPYCNDKSQSIMHYGGNGSVIIDAPDKSLLVIRIAGDAEGERKISGASYFTSCYYAQQNSMQDFVEKGHQHIYMNLKERSYLNTNKKFPKRVADIITGKTILPPLAEVIKG